MDGIKEAARGAFILTLRCLGVVALIVSALWIGGPIYSFAGVAGVISELIWLMFLVLFLGSLFGKHFSKS